MKAMILSFSMLAIMMAVTNPSWGQGEAVMKLMLNSDAFQPGGEIPREFTCQGENKSPKLTLGGIPKKAKSLTLIMDDPDAPRGTWVHWVLYDLPPNTLELPMGAGLQPGAEQGGMDGKNDFGKQGYGGPCPPAGKAHRYFFKLYALDQKLGLKPGASKDDLERAMQGHILAQAELMGTYQRR